MIEFLSSAWIYVVPFLIMISVIVTVHELGHFLVARAFGVAVDRFSIGFGKALWSRTDKHGCEWRIAWIPLGGYVRFAGDSNDASVPNPEELEGLRKEIEEQLGKDQVANFYHFKPVWQRALIAVAGPAANFALAIVIFAGVLMSVGEPRATPQFTSIMAGGPAETAGLRPGDTVERLDGRAIKSYDDIVSHVRLRAGEPIRFDIRRNGEPLTLTVTPRRVTGKNELTGYKETYGQIGAGHTGLPVMQTYNLPQAIGRGSVMVVDTISGTLTFLRRVITGRESATSLSGVVGMADVTGKVIKSVTSADADAQAKARALGIRLMLLAGSISVGLGFVNLLPIPVLDGGHLMFYAYEAIARRPAGPKVQSASFRVGLALVLCLMLFANWNDLQRMQAFKFLGGLFS